MKRKCKAAYLLVPCLLIPVLICLFPVSSHFVGVSPAQPSPPAPVSLSAPLAKNTKGFSASDRILEVPYLSQEGILPTGCEAVSAAMVLQYWGVDIDAVELAEILPCSPLSEKKGELYGPDPNEYFVGSPFDPDSYGCYAPVIEKVISQAAPSLSAQVLYDCSLDTLYQEYVSQGIPVLLWCTINMQESYHGAAWLLPDGSPFVWRSNEHCLVLAGRENGEYICMDPYDSNGQISIPSALLEQRYEEMGSQSVIVVPKP